MTPFNCLQDFLLFLEKKGDLLRISTEVDPILEITEIATRVVQKRGPALLFERVKGSSFPAVINLWGADRRVEWALGQSPENFGRMVARFGETVMPPSPRSLWTERSTFKRLWHMKPSLRSHGPVFSNRIEPPDLNGLPVAQSWPKDGGRFLTFPLVLTQSPLNGKRNLGVYRMQLYDRGTTGMHWQIAKGGGYHYHQAEKLDQNLPVSVIVGADPVLMLCGVMPLPEGIDEISFAGFLRGRATRMGCSPTRSYSIPTEAEFVLEGFVPPKERRIEGPYGDHFGHYSHPAPFPVFHVERIWHRNGPIFPLAVVGKPPQEDQVLGDAIQTIMLPLLKLMHPEISDLWAYHEAGFHNLLVIGVNQRFAKEGIKTALWSLGEGQLALTKCVILVDSDINAKNFKDVLNAVRRNFDPAQDFILLPGTSQDTLDFTGFKMNLGSKMIWDATTNGVGRTDQSKAEVTDVASVKRLDSRIREAVLLEDSLLVIQTEKEGRVILQKIANLPDIHLPPIVVAVSPDVSLQERTLLIWGIFTRFDCERDTFFSSAQWEGGHPKYKGSLFIDATWKPGYPDPLEMDPSIVKKVDQKWSIYGFKN